MATENNKMLKTCRGCTYKCIASHSNSIPNNFSFFKRMLSNFSSFLEIPSKCVKHMQKGTRKNAILEGPSGHLWHVGLFCTSTSAFFQDGWDKFVSDNSVEAEDIVVCRHVINMHFIVQIFGSSGYEKQSIFPVENHGSCCLKKGDPPTLCIQRKCEYKDKNIEPSVFRENSFAVKQRRNDGTKIENLTTGTKEFSSKCEIKYIKLRAGTILINSRKVYTVEDSSAETCISNDKPGFLDNRVLLSPSKINSVDATRLAKAKCHGFGNPVGSCAEQPIVLDAEEEIHTHGSSAYNHDKDTVGARYHSALEGFQEKRSRCGKFEGSLCNNTIAVFLQCQGRSSRSLLTFNFAILNNFKADLSVPPVKGEKCSPLLYVVREKGREKSVAPVEGEKCSPLLCFDREKRRKKSVTTEMKFSVVIRKTAVAPPCWLNIPAGNYEKYFRHNDVVLLLGQDEEWKVAFKVYNRRHGFSCGWRQFVADNKLEEGDTCVFELINQVNHAFKVDILRAVKKDNHGNKKGVQEGKCFGKHV